MQGSRWAKISYGDGLHYSFGTISHDGEVKFLCYAVPAQRESLLKDNPTPPKSLHGRATFIPVDDGGYWVMYQDAVTGKSVT